MASRKGRSLRDIQTRLARELDKPRTKKSVKRRAKKSAKRGAKRRTAAQKAATLRMLAANRRVTRRRVGKKSAARGLGRLKRRSVARRVVRRDDNLNWRGNPDRARININEAWELAYWTKRFGVSRTRLIAAVKKTMPFPYVTRVEATLRTRTNRDAPAGKYPISAEERAENAKWRKTTLGKAWVKREKQLKRQRHKQYGNAAFLTSRDANGGNFIVTAEPTHRGSFKTKSEAVETAKSWARETGKVAKVYQYDPTQYRSRLLEKHGGKSAKPCKCGPKKRAKKRATKAASRRGGRARSYRDVMRDLGFRS